MTPREFFDAVVDIREKGKAYYAYQADFQDPKKKELLKAAKDAERKVDNEIMRVLELLAKKNAPAPVQSPVIEFKD